jgi:hypothetical protein
VPAPGGAVLGSCQACGGSIWDYDASASDPGERDRAGALPRREQDMRPMPQNANEFIEQELDERMRAIEDCFNADAFAFNGPLLFRVDDVVREVVERKAAAHVHEKMVVVLTTDGGYIEVVQRIVETLRRHYGVVEFIIPNHAFSAGTVLALSGDAIHMDYYSRLGPIDPQVEARGGKAVPALGYLVQYERLLNKAEQGAITAAEMQILLDFDQAELYKYEQARELSITLLREWLARYKFKNWYKTRTQGVQVDEAMRCKRAEEVAGILNDTKRWHTHGRGISRDVLERDLNLIIDDFGSDPERSRRIHGYHNLRDDYMMKRGNAGVVHTIGEYVAFLPLT